MKLSIGKVLDLDDNQLNKLIAEQNGCAKDYCSNHKAISYLEDSIPKKDFLRYRDYLITIVGSRYFIASPRQRAEAYLLTFQSVKPKFKNATNNKNQKVKTKKDKPQARKCPTKAESKKPKVNYRRKTSTSK